MLFASTLPAGSFRYAGQNISYGDPTTPIFWYRPTDSATWRIIYADLHTADVAPEDLPQ